jgi:perosamine synthetase
MIPVARLLMDERETDAAGRVIRSGWITQGPEVAAFEDEFAAAVGTPHACAVSSCTAAMHVALVAAGVGPGDEVITVSHSFIATANAVRYCGAMPVFVDIDEETFNMDPALVESAVTARTKAILCVHQLGMPCDLGQIVAIGRRRGLVVIEDAACAVGSEILWEGEWQRVGRPHGDIACFSFHPRKVISTGDGGMITTTDAVLDRQFRLLRQHGMSVPDTVRHASSTVIDEIYPVLGFNYRLTDIQAAVGREQLARLTDIVERRRGLAARYQQDLAGMRGVGLVTEPAWARSNWQSYSVRLEPQLDRRMVMQRMLDAGVSTRRGAMNAHGEGAFPKDSWIAALGGLSRSEQAQNATIVLPLFPQMTEPEQDQVVQALADAVGQSA